MRRSPAWTGSFERVASTDPWAQRWRGCARSGGSRLLRPHRDPSRPQTRTPTQTTDQSRPTRSTGRPHTPPVTRTRRHRHDAAAPLNWGNATSVVTQTALARQARRSQSGGRRERAAGRGRACAHALWPRGAILTERTPVSRVRASVCTAPAPQTFVPVGRLATLALAGSVAA